MKHVQRIWFIFAVAVGWGTVGLSEKMVTPNDGTTTESIVPHFIGWLLLMAAASMASFMPEWRDTGRTWQKVVFWFLPCFVILDIILHWALFGFLKKSYAQLSSSERILATVTYLAIGPLFLATLLALLTQLGKRRNAIQS
jgi:hypothetical protein